MRAREQSQLTNHRPKKLLTWSSRAKPQLRPRASTRVSWSPPFWQQKWYIWTIKCMRLRPNMTLLNTNKTCHVSKYHHCLASTAEQSCHSQWRSRNSSRNSCRLWGKPWLDFQLISMWWELKGFTKDRDKLKRGVYSTINMLNKNKLNSWTVS